MSNQLCPVKEVSCERVNEDISIMVPHDLSIPAGSEEEKDLGKEILKFYTNKNTLSWDIDNIKGYVDVSLDKYKKIIIINRKVMYGVNKKVITTLEFFLL